MPGTGESDGPLFAVFSRLELSVAPYPGWYFFVVSLGFYFTLNVAMLALPIVFWVLVCWREIGVLLQADPKKS